MATDLDVVTDVARGNGRRTALQDEQDLESEQDCEYMELFLTMILNVFAVDIQRFHCLKLTILLKIHCNAAMEEDNQLLKSTSPLLKIHF